MQTTSTLFDIHDRDARADGPAFLATAIHDTFAASIRAREALLWLKHSLFDLDVRSNFWSFKSLERPDARAASLREAATAHALIISASETVAVPDQIKGWLDSTLQQQDDGSRAVLVVLHDGSEIPCDDPGPLCSYVEQQACRWQTECMCNQVFDDRLDRDYAVQLISMKKSEQIAGQPNDDLATPLVGQKLLGSIFKAFASFAVMVGFITGCASKPLELFKDERPIFKPEEYFAGHTRSWGTFEKRSGEPTKIIQTETIGHWQDGILHFEQDIVIAHGKKEHRSWLIRRLDEHHYSATGTGIVGTARGESRGNAFHLEFTLDALPGNPLGRVHMSQWMYLQADGVTMINRATVTKAGVVITEITEHFRKER